MIAGALERVVHARGHDEQRDSAREHAGNGERSQSSSVVFSMYLAAVISVASGALLEAAAIAGVVLANAAIGYRTEDRAERVIQSLAAPGQDTARVVRGGEAKEVPAELIVPGDLVLLQRGMIVPADARLTSVRELTVSEASLTGESKPVAKSVQALSDQVPLGGRS